MDQFDSLFGDYIDPLLTTSQLPLQQTSQKSLRSSWSGRSDSKAQQLDSDNLEFRADRPHFTQTTVAVGSVRIEQSKKYNLLEFGNGNVCRVADPPAGTWTRLRPNLEPVCTVDRPSSIVQWHPSLSYRLSVDQQHLSVQFFSKRSNQLSTTFRLSGGADVVECRFINDMYRPFVGRQNGANKPATGFDGSISGSVLLDRVKRRVHTPELSSLAVAFVTQSGNVNVISPHQSAIPHLDKPVAQVADKDLTTMRGSLPLESEQKLRYCRLIPIDICKYLLICQLEDTTGLLLFILTVNLLKPEIHFEKLSKAPTFPASVGSIKYHHHDLNSSTFLVEYMVNDGVKYQNGFSLFEFNIQNNAMEVRMNRLVDGEILRWELNESGDKLTFVTADEQCLSMILPSMELHKQASVDSFNAIRAEYQFTNHRCLLACDQCPYAFETGAVNTQIESFSRYFALALINREQYIDILWQFRSFVLHSVSKTLSAQRIIEEVMRNLFVFLSNSNTAEFWKSLYENRPELHGIEDSSVLHYLGEKLLALSRSLFIMFPEGQVQAGSVDLLLFLNQLKSELLNKCTVPHKDAESILHELRRGKKLANQINFKSDQMSTIIADALKFLASLSNVIKQAYILFHTVKVPKSAAQLDGFGDPSPTWLFVHPLPRSLILDNCLLLLSLQNQLKTYLRECRKQTVSADANLLIAFKKLDQAITETFQLKLETMVKVCAEITVISNRIHQKSAGQAESTIKKYMAMSMCCRLPDSQLMKSWLSATKSLQQLSDQEQILQEKIKTCFENAFGEKEKVTLTPWRQDIHMRASLPNGNGRKPSDGNVMFAGTGYQTVNKNLNDANSNFISLFE